MSSLTKNIMDGKDKEKIKKDIDDAFVQQDTILVVRALPGCKELFTIQNSMTEEKNDVNMIGKDAVSRLQYAIRRLLKIICTHLKGVVLFVDDLQWSDTATLDLLQSISLDSEIPSLLLVGAYREDEVPE